MKKLQHNCTHVAIVGGGPYGLSIAAHLRGRGVPFRIFGRPMQTWATQMPVGMRLKSDGFASNLSTPGTNFTLARFCAETGRSYHDTLLPVALEDFVAYGLEFANRCVPMLEQVDITALDREEELFRLRTATGETVYARNVILATGLSLFKHVPQELRNLPPGRVTHAAQHRTFDEFAGRDVTVLGRGASSLNAAVLLHEAGARVTLISRSRKIHIHEPNQPGERPVGQRLMHPLTPLGTSVRSWLACTAPDLFHLLPARLRQLLVYKHLGPAGGSALKGRIQGFPVLLGCKMNAIEAASGSGDRLRLNLTDGDGRVHHHLTSHLIAGTGYRTDLRQLRFVADNLLDAIRVDHRGAPRLNRHFQSSVPGLYMAGPITAPAFGPLLRFVAGTEFAAERIAGHMERSYARQRHRERRTATVGIPTSATRERV